VGNYIKKKRLSILHATPNRSRESLMLMPAGDCCHVDCDRGPDLGFPLKN